MAKPVPAPAFPDTGPVDYSTIAAPIMDFVRSVECRLPWGPQESQILRLLLAAMRETHESMRAIHKTASAVESEEKRKIGAHFDMVLLARPQVESVFLGLLILHDPGQWFPRYIKAAWAAECKQCHFEYLLYGHTREGQEGWTRYKEYLKQRALELKITTEEEEAVRNEVEDTGGPTSKAPKMPTPGEVYRASHLVGGLFESLAAILWREWKFQCDPSHVGLNGLTTRARLREDPIPRSDAATREQVLQQLVLFPSIHTSLCSLLCLATAVFVRHFKADPILAGLCAKAWELPSKRTLLGQRMWNEWAMKALGILNPPAP